MGFLMSAFRARRRVGFGVAVGWLALPLFASALIGSRQGDPRASGSRPLVYAAEVEALIHPVSA